VHAHPPYAIALAHTIRSGGITPIHNEALVGLRWIPIIDTSVDGREGGEDPRGIAEQLASWCSLIVRGHGAFSTGASLSEALYKMFLLDDVCRISTIVQSIRREATLTIVGKPSPIKHRRVKRELAIR
jgi:ribulose-5-phosphate 4-epimerase/fuculose-1-phosphate aldolase